MLRIYTIENTRYNAPPPGHVSAFLSRADRDEAIEKLRAQARADGLAESAVKAGIVASSFRADDDHPSIEDIADEPGLIVCVGVLAE